MANYTLNYTGEKVDELLNKIDTAFGETTVMSDTITWDGNTDGLYSVLGMFYKVSDAVPTLADLQKGGTIGTIGLGGGDTTFTSDNVMNVEDLGAGNDCIVIMNGENPVVGVALKEGATVTLQGATATFEETGVFLLRQYMEAYNLLVYIAKFVVNGYSGFETTEVKPIDPKFAPIPKTYFYRSGSALYVDEEHTKLATTIDVKTAYDKGLIEVKADSTNYLVYFVNFAGYPIQIQIGTSNGNFTIGSLD
ncbi:MAG: hypothetical protein IKW21_01145 [Lachnospiraceae bacterium]|nr:hypothetical protein [Lachnospiraceae bacterium]